MPPGGREEETEETMVFELLWVPEPRSVDNPGASIWAGGAEKRGCVGGGQGASQSIPSPQRGTEDTRHSEPKRSEIAAESSPWPHPERLRQTEMCPAQEEGFRSN